MPQIEYFEIWNSIFEVKFTSFKQNQLISDSFKLDKNAYLCAD